MRGRLADACESTLTRQSFGELAKIERRIARHNLVAGLALLVILAGLGAIAVFGATTGTGTQGPFEPGGCNGGQVSYFYGGQPVGATPVDAVRLWTGRHPSGLPVSGWVSAGHDAGGDILRADSTYFHVAEVASGWRVNKIAQCAQS